MSELMKAVQELPPASVELVIHSLSSFESIAEREQLDKQHVLRMAAALVRCDNRHKDLAGSQ